MPSHKNRKKKLKCTTPLCNKAPSSCDECQAKVCGCQLARCGLTEEYVCVTCHTTYHELKNVCDECKTGDVNCLTGAEECSLCGKWLCENCVVPDCPECQRNRALCYSCAITKEGKRQKCDACNTWRCLSCLDPWMRCDMCPSTGHGCFLKLVCTAIFCDNKTNHRRCCLHLQPTQEMFKSMHICCDRALCEIHSRRWSPMRNQWVCLECAPLDTEWKETLNFIAQECVIATRLLPQLAQIVALYLVSVPPAPPPPVHVPSSGDMISNPPAQKGVSTQDRQV